MRPSGLPPAFGLLVVAVGGCNLVSLDDLQEIGGAGGSASAGATSASSTTESTSPAAGGGAAVSSSASASASTSASTSSGASTSASQGSSSSASQSSAAGTGGGGGAPTGLYAETVLGDGPIAYLRLDEVAGENTVADAVGPYDGTLVGVVTWSEPGAIAGDPGTSIRFDGASGLLSLGDVLDFPGGGPFSVELWVKTGPDTPSEIEWLFSKEADFADDRKGYTCLISTKLTLGAEVWAGFPPSVAYFGGPLVKETWHHVVMTASASELDIWVDGVAFNDGGNAGALVDHDGVLTFAAQTGGQGHFNGWLDEIAIYDFELSTAQIAAHIAAAR